MKKTRLREILNTVSPILINPNKSSITIGMSKRFFLFQLMEKVSKQIEDDPYLNFISILKNYKVLGRFLHGTIKELHKDRNTHYFKNFFMDKELYKSVKKDIEELYPRYQQIKTVISKNGVIIYDNYKKHDFNVLLLTIHAGQWVPEQLKDKIMISKKDRFKEEDIDSDKIYSQLVLEKGGIWVNNKLSRFVCDFNRAQINCMYFKKKEKWLHKEVWNQNINKKDIDKIYSWHFEFYKIIHRLVESYEFNIIFDGHTMKDQKDHPKMSFGTRYIPEFYRPIVKSMAEKMRRLKYRPLYINKPYSGGFILKWLKMKFPNRFIFSMEINKKLYMSNDRKKSLKRKIGKIGKEVSKIFDI